MSSSQSLLNRPRLWLLCAANGTVTAQAGDIGATVVRNGAGDYTVTLDPGLDSAFNSLRAGLRAGAGDANIQATWTSDTEIAVLTFVAAVATDEIFELELVTKRAAEG